MSETATLHRSKAPKKLNVAVIVCSSSRYKSSLKNDSIIDISGDLICRLLRENGHMVIFHKIVPDEKKIIQQTMLKTLKSRKINVIITSGGTGIAPKDVTIEAVKPLFEKIIDGFGEIFRYLSYKKIGSAAFLTRAIAGISKGKVIFCLPGSPQSVKLAVEKLIIPEAGHILTHSKED